MRNLKHKTTIAIYYFIFVNISFFLAPFLVNAGISQEKVGYYNSTAILLLIGMFLLTGVITDIFKKNKPIIIINMLISSIAFIGLTLTNNINMILFFYFLIWMFFMSSAAIIDGLIIKDVNEENYSQVRLWGSVGAAISYFVNSYVLSNLNPKIIFSVNAFLIIVVIVLLLMIKEHYYQNKLKYIQGLKSVVSTPVILLIILGTFFTYGVLGGDDAFSYLFETTEVGISGTTIGIIGLVSILLEAILIYFFPILKEKLNLKKLLLICSLALIVVFIVRSFCYTIPALIIVGDITIGIFTGLFIPSAVYLIANNSSDSIKNTILGIYQMTIKLGAVIIGTFTTMVYSATNQYHSIYKFHLALVLVGLLIFIIFAFTIKDNEQ